MKIPQNRTGLSTAGAAGIVLMTLHITGYLTGWGWHLLYVFCILSGIGFERGNK